MGTIGTYGSGREVATEGDIETSTLLTSAKGDRWAFELTNAVAHEEGSETPRELKNGKKFSYFMPSALGIKARDRFIELLGLPKDEEFNTEMVEGYRVRFRTIPTKTAFNDYLPETITRGKEAAATVEPLTEAEVVALLIGKTPSEAQAVAKVVGIAGTRWAKVVTVKNAVLRDLPVQVDADGKYASR